MIDDAERGKVVTVSAASRELFGECTDASRKRIRKLVDRGTLRAMQLTGEGAGSPYWVTRSSMDRLIRELDCNDPDAAA